MMSVGETFTNLREVIKEDKKEVLVGAVFAQKVLKLSHAGGILLEIPNEATGEIKGGFKGVPCTRIIFDVRVRRRFLETMRR